MLTRVSIIKRRTARFSGRVVVVAGVAVAGAAGPLAPPADAQAPVESIAAIPGTCRSLVVAGEDLGAECRGPALSFQYGGGRRSFAFPYGDALISFSGAAEPGDEGGVRLVLDMITWGQSESGLQSAEAEGSCDMASEGSGAPVIRCEARTESGVFSVSFESSGEPPEVRRF